MALPPIPPPGFDDLSGEEKLDYIQALWDRVAAYPDEVPVPERLRELSVAEAAPAEPPRPDEVFGCLAGRYEEAGDLVAPVLPLESWDVLK